MRKRRNALLLAMITFMFVFSACGGDDDDRYACKHCGREMEAYWSYHGGYVCYSCDKKYYK